MKKIIYIFAVMALLISFSVLVCGVLELMGLSYYSKPVVFFMLIIIGGYNLGQRWWDYIYVQKKHTNKWIDKISKNKK